MGDLQVWKIGIDALLALAVVWMAFQFLISSPVSEHKKQFAALEGTLRGMIREADEAGRTLNEQLLRRQQNLEKLLLDFESSERRITSLLGHIERAKSQLDQARMLSEQSIKAAERRPIELREQMEMPRQAEVPPQSPLQARVSNKVESSENIVQTTSVTNPQLSHSPTITRSAGSGRAVTRWAGPSSVNIYGEPIGATNKPTSEVATSAKLSPKMPLSSQVVREVTITPAAPALSKVYEAAELLLKAGKDLQEVIAITKLPENDVRMLAQVVTGESRVASEVIEDSRESLKSSGADPRLGVLGGIKREVHVV